MNHHKFRAAWCSLAGLLMAAGTFGTLAATGTIQGQLDTKVRGTTIAVGAMVEALDAADATVVQMGIVDFNRDSGSGTFTLALPPGAYRVCFRFASSPGDFLDRRSFYNPVLLPAEPYCFSEGAVVNVAAGSATTIDAFVGYNIDPVKTLLTVPGIGGMVTEPGGAPLPGITVGLLDPCTGYPVSTYITEADGLFSFAKLEPGSDWVIRYWDPTGRYATGFLHANNFVDAPVIPQNTLADKVLFLSPPRIVVDPMTYDFGNVELPGSATAIVTIQNRGGADLQVISLTLYDETTSYITIKSAPVVPFTLGFNQSCDVELAFVPRALGAVADSLMIGSDDPNHGRLKVPLSGNGVVSSAPPAEQVATTLDFITDTVADGTLQGAGSGGSPSAHVQALMNQIKAASDLAAAGKLSAACAQLRSALERADGDPQPPDFVTGPAAAELMLLIELTRQAIGCR